MQVSQNFINALPKVELHLHIEGSLEPELMFKLAHRNNLQIPFTCVEEVREAYNFGNLQDFLDIYYQGMNVLDTERDFYDLTWAYLERISGQNVQHTEIFFDPQGHTSRGVDLKDVVGGISRALKDGKDKLGITSHLIMCFLRHLSEEDALETLEAALPYKDKIYGVGLDSSEKDNPPANFAKVFFKAREAGFKVAVAHAGEEGPAEYVYESLDILGVDRIDHGNHALDNDELVKRLAKGKIAMTVCPLSNLRLCVVKDMKDHPLKKMLDLGLKATINSDDPAYFGGYMNENYTAVAQALPLSRDDILQLARNGIDASFADDRRKAELHRNLAEFAAQAE